MTLTTLLADHKQFWSCSIPRLHTVFAWYDITPILVSVNSLYLNVIYLVTVLSNEVTWSIVHLQCLPPYQHGWKIGKFCCNRRWYPATYSDQLVPDNRNTKRHLVPHGAVTLDFSRKIIVTRNPILQLNVSRKVILTWDRILRHTLLKITKLFRVIHGYISLSVLLVGK